MVKNAVVVDAVGMSAGGACFVFASGWEFELEDIFVGGEVDKIDGARIVIGDKDIGVGWPKAWMTA